MKKDKKCFLFLTLFLFLILLLSQSFLFAGTISGTFTSLQSSPMNLTCFTVDPTTGLMYGQGDQSSTNYYRYDPSTNTWTTLTSCPVTSGNNGGATYMGGKIYNSYCSHTDMTVYDIASNSWSTISGGLQTGDISNDGTDVYVCANNVFKKWDISASSWVSLAGTSTQPWGGLEYLNGYFYMHTGNGSTGFKKYNVSTDTWSDLTNVPYGAVLGSAIFDAYYYCMGSYGGTNLYSYDLGAEEWNNTLTLPFSINDAAIVVYNNSLYIVQGEAGTGFTRFTPNNPILTGIEGTPINYTVGSGTTLITSTITGSDNDDTHFESATVEITNNFESGKDILAFVNANGITGAWNSGAGILTLTGTATIANYDTALRSVTYSNSSYLSTENTRIVFFQVNDGTMDSNFQSRNIIIDVPADVPAPTVTTQAVTNISTTTATGNGNITDLGDPDPTQHGVCWGTSQNPTTADNKTEEGAASATGAFASSMTGLTAGATYYVRAYATNSVGTSYGDQVSFTTRATTTSTTADGNWSSTSTWSGGLVPLSAQSVTISNNVTLDTTAEVNGLTISANKTLTFSSTNTLTVNGSATISGTMNVASGSCNVTGASAVTGTLTIGTGTYTANGSFDVTGGNVTFTGAGTLNLAGTIGCGGLGTFTKATGCTVDYKLNGAQSVSAVDYYHLKLSTGGTKTLCGHLTVGNSSGIDGNLTIASDVTFDVSGSNFGMEIAGNWSNSGTFTARAGTVTFTGASDSTVASGGSSFYGLTLNKSAGEVTTKLSPSTDLTGTNALTITKGTFDLDTSDVNLILGGALNIGVNGRWTKSSDNDNTLTFTGAGCTITDSSSPVQDLGHVKVGD